MKWSTPLLLAAVTMVGCKKAPDWYLIRPPARKIDRSYRDPAVREATRTVLIDRLVYSYDLLIPKVCEGRISPVVIALHGRGSNGEEAISAFGMEHLAAKDRFIVVAANGQDGQWHDLDGDFLQQRDLRFFQKVLDDIPNLGGDPSRVYVTGFSNGGGMTHILGSVFGDRIAAIGSGGASIGALDMDLKYHQVPTPKRAMPVLMFHGMKDQSCGYDMSTFTVAVPDAAKWWAKQNGLPLTPRREVKGKGQVLVDHYGSEDGPEVVLMSYRTMGHTWPSVEDRNTGMVFDDVLWSFFSRHRLPTVHNSVYGRSNPNRLARSTGG